MERWPWQILGAGKCTGTAWGQVCPQWHPVRNTFKLLQLAAETHSLTVLTKILSKPLSA